MAIIWNIPTGFVCRKIFRARKGAVGSTQYCKEGFHSIQLKNAQKKWRAIFAAQAIEP